MKMKVKPGSGKGCAYNVPLPIVLLLSSGFFFAGYYVSLANQEVAEGIAKGITRAAKDRDEANLDCIQRLAIEIEQREKLLEKLQQQQLQLPREGITKLSSILSEHGGQVAQDNALAKQNQENQRLQLLENGLEFAFEHGESGDDMINGIPFQVLSWAPRALIFPRFATKLQCEHIIALAKTRLAPSGLALRKGESASQTKDVRTSSGTFLAWHQDKTGTLEFIEEKMSKATMIPRKNGEAFNVLRYQIGQKYNSHYDVFNPAEYGPQKSQRIASMLLYLSDVEEGGETMFPFENYNNMNNHYDYKQCIGLKVKPRQGDALLFYSIHPNGTFDAAALHGSCPVIKGEKWVATKWMRDNIF